MQVEVGSIVEGKVTGITHFGAFIAMNGGQTGMVHISEISNSYVKEIGDFLAEDQEVKVKVLSVADDGKISLSIKRCEENADQGEGRPNAVARPNVRRQPQQRRQQQKTVEWQPKQADSAGDMDFEDMMTKFKQVSNDRMGELKRANDPRRTRRGGSTPR